MSHSRLGLADGWGQIQNLRFNQEKSSFVSCFQVILIIRNYILYFIYFLLYLGWVQSV